MREAAPEQITDWMKFYVREIYKNSPASSFVCHVLDGVKICFYKELGTN
jgi:hypothetical protein